VQSCPPRVHCCLPLPPVNSEGNVSGCCSITIGSSIKLAGGCVHRKRSARCLRLQPRGRAARSDPEASRIQRYQGFAQSTSPAFVDAYDRMGLLMMDEAFDCWSKGKNPQDYSAALKDWWKRDIDAMICRDRNPPGVVRWSIGNEIPERGDPLGAAEAKTIADYVRKLDSTRLITSALNSSWASGATRTITTRQSISRATTITSTTTWPLPRPGFKRMAQPPSMPALFGALASQIGLKLG
jgi:hypothetical protein